MTNLFSIFDPQTTLMFNIPLNWTITVMTIMFFPCFFWVSKNQYNKSFEMIMNALHVELQAMLGSISSPGLTMLPLTFFIMILSTNLIGLFPYIFTASSHLTFTISLALPLWVGHMIMGWTTLTNNMFAHLVPLGTPGPLMPFMVLIEMVSNVIRPLTLSVRLAANMIAGHLLLTLLSSLIPGASYILMTMVIWLLLMLMLLELAVSMIQAYVFTVLSTLYFNEINNPKLSIY